MNALGYVTRAMRSLGAIASGEAPSNAEAQDGLEILNAMVDAWRLQRLAIFFSTENEFDIVAGQQTYSIGPTGADFTQARPITIERASCVQYTNPLRPIELPVDVWTDQRWQSIPVKNTTSALFTRMRYRPLHPNGSIDVWPIPNTALVKIKLYTPCALTAFVDLNTNYVVAPGYEEALVYNLAVRYAPELSRPLDPTVLRMAQDSLARVKVANIPLDEMRIDPALIPVRQSFDWRIG